ncbi:MAG: flagellar FliJ family protein [Alphaproteobacteria bacterium]|nr:flagellar FliJ family protein [Alphaproteobacteria bacterium]
MNKSLQTLNRIQKFKIDEQRKLMVEKMNEEERIVENIRRLNARYEEEKIFSAQNPGIGDFGLYTKRYLELREEQEMLLQQVRQEIEEIRDKISEMFKEQKTFEIVDEQRKKEARKELEQKEQKQLDEIGTNAYIKHHEEA